MEEPPAGTGTQTSGTSNSRSVCAMQVELEPKKCRKLKCVCDAGIT